LRHTQVAQGDSIPERNPMAKLTEPSTSPYGWISHAYIPEERVSCYRGTTWQFPRYITKIQLYSIGAIGPRLELSPNANSVLSMIPPST